MCPEFRKRREVSRGCASNTFTVGKMHTREVTPVKKPVVDEDMCTGCGLCPDIAPGTFAMNDDGVAEVIDPQGDDEDAIQESIDTCPVEAISWE